jgi:hypothetical protein
MAGLTRTQQLGWLALLAGVALWALLRLGGVL